MRVKLRLSKKEGPGLGDIQLTIAVQGRHASMGVPLPASMGVWLEVRRCLAIVRSPAS